MDLIASQYGWRLADIEDLTYRQAKKTIKAIEARTEQEEYMTRLHIALQATAIIKALSAALQEQECGPDELVGPPPGETPIKAAKGNTK